VRSEYREEPCRSALNPVSGMDFNWSLNPYTGCAHRCTFCYVRAYEKRADRPSDDRYGGSIRVKVNVAEVLRFELSRPAWKRETVVIGAATDPYQPAEGRYRLTRACLEALADFRTPFGIITRGTLIVRDVDVLARAARRAKVSISFSIPTLDREVWRRTEIATPPPEQRLRALAVLTRAGIRAGVAMAPILPGISDHPEQLAAVARAARDAGAAFLWASPLHLRPGTREHFLAHLARDWPDQLPLYQGLYSKRSYLEGPASREIQERVSEVRRLNPLPRREGFLIAPPEDPVQLDLAI
jgi:DNA repair photolyase